MPKLTDNSYPPSPRARMYLVIGMTVLASIMVLYIVLSGPNSAMSFLKSHPLPLLLLATLFAVLSGWLQARDPRLRPGLFFKSLGKSLMIFAASAVLLFRPSIVFVLAFLLGYISSVIGSMQFRAARRSETNTQSQ
jgi:hypothetical protein